MKGFAITQLLIYDPKKSSIKRKPIEIDIQEAKILVYWPEDVPIEQKCNTVGMAEGVYSFCDSLFKSKEQEKQEKTERGWQTIHMDECTIILSEVEQDIWIFVKLQHTKQSYYYRLGEREDNYYLQNTFTDQICKRFMNHLYNCLKIFYGPIRGWVFRQRIEQYQKIITSFVKKYEQIFKYESSLDIITYIIKDIRLIPLDVNSTLKFTYFKNVLQSYDANIAHLIIFSYGFLAFTSINKQTTEFFANYFYATGEPYSFVQNRKSKLTLLPQVPKNYVSQKFGVYYNSKSIGAQQQKQYSRDSVAIKQNADLLGLGTQGNRFELFQVFIDGQQQTFRINYYYENSMLFLTFYKLNPDINQLIFQNRFYHDNADKFLLKINESLNGVLKTNDPYKFIFHNAATYSGKSTIKQWKHVGNQIKDILQLLSQRQQGSIATMTNQGYWIYGIHRLCRILILLIPSDTPLAKIQEFMNKMMKEYFARAYI